MNLKHCGEAFNSDFLFETQNKFILYNVCDNYMIVNMTEFFLINLKSNGIVLTFIVLIISFFLLKVLNLVVSRFIVSDVIFSKQYLKIKEQTLAIYLAIPMIGMIVMMPKKAYYGIEQIMSSNSILFIMIFCLILPMSFFSHLHTMSGILFPKKLFGLTIGTFVLSNLSIELYGGYTNHVDYIIIVFLVLLFICYIALFLMFSKMDVSDHRNISKKEGHKLTSKFVTLEFEIKEIVQEQESVYSDEDDDDDLGESEAMGRSKALTSSLTASKMQTGLYNTNMATLDDLSLTSYTKIDPLEEFLNTYELSLEQRIRESQKNEVAEEFSNKLFFNEDEQKEILRNQKIGLWDKVFAEFSSGLQTSEGEELFEKMFIVFLALSLPSLKNPLMKTNWMPFIIHNCVVLSFYANDFVYHFDLNFYWFFIIGIVVAGLISGLNKSSAWSYTTHRYVCFFLCVILGLTFILDICFILADFIIFFAFYFKYNTAMTLGLSRTIRYVLPNFYLIDQLCKANHYMVAIMFSMLLLVTNGTLLIANSFTIDIKNNTTKYDGFTTTLKIYDKKTASLLTMAGYYVFFYGILMSFLMVIKKYKFDTSLMFLSVVLFAVFCYSIA